MNESDNQIKGLYKLIYGYSHHELLFVETRERIEKGKNENISLETSKHNMEDVDLEDITLVTENQKFIDLFLKHKLESSINPLDFVNWEAMEEDDEFEEEHPPIKNKPFKRVQFITAHMGCHEFFGNLDFIHSNVANLTGAKTLNKTKEVIDRIGGYEDCENPEHYLNEVLKIDKEYPMSKYQIGMKNLFRKLGKGEFSKSSKWFQILMFLKHSTNDSTTFVFHYGE
jgi:hypothetical protein